jgi:hypothetical protein
VSRDQLGGSPTAVNLSSRPEPLLFHSSSSSADWIPFQTHCYSQNLVAPGIERRTLEVSRLDHGGGGEPWNFSA